ncbi:hypothetical protein HPB50_012339 [Hyalomma asiaticum]|uniref:Uncharacterized protein n=1 Tax=Hyalomma asiaticum TaxID=266040 RepID=A0ACB7S096_HYAAI|nr:hypothetical protein HPB50_012339 [Hyalomma asiaticum]
MFAGLDFQPTNKETSAKDKERARRGALEMAKQGHKPDYAVSCLRKTTPLCPVIPRLWRYPTPMSAQLTCAEATEARTGQDTARLFFAARTTAAPPLPAGIFRCLMQERRALVKGAATTRLQQRSVSHREESSCGCVQGRPSVGSHERSAWIFLGAHDSALPQQQSTARYFKSYHGPNGNKKREYPFFCSRPLRDSPAGDAGKEAKPAGFFVSCRRHQATGRAGSVHPLVGIAPGQPSTSDAIGHTAGAGLEKAPKERASESRHASGMFLFLRPVRRMLPSVRAPADETQWRGCQAA